MPPVAAGSASSLPATRTRIDSSRGRDASLTCRLQRRIQLPRQIGRQHGALAHAYHGKKRRKPQSNSGSSRKGSGGDRPTPAQPPPRVDPTINISVRKQQRWAKMKKEYEEYVASGFRRPAPVKQAFRRESMNEEEYRQ
jgi:hypothetical protein